MFERDQPELVPEARLQPDRGWPPFDLAFSRRSARIQRRSDTVYYAGDAVTRDGALWQATKDTGQAPPHAD